MNQSPRAATSALYALGLIAALAAGAWVLWSAGALFWSLVPAEDDAAGAGTAQMPSATMANPATRVDIASLHLFGQVGAVVRPEVFEAPETQLNLSLLGTLAADDPAAGLAIVADEGGKQGYYGAGDELPGGAVLREVHLTRVVLEHQGRRETLSLDRDAANDATQPRRTAATGPSAAPANSNFQRQIGAIDWQAATAQSRIDPQKLAELGSQIRALPFSENGKPIGIRLMAARDARVLSRLGLRSSDIILEVNGIPLSDASRQFELLNLLENQSRFQVRLRRNGREMTLNVDASQLQNP